ncbi:hypothetical protein ACFU3E_17015 [Streptomyces sp. NPDC057424]|uniref:hypothetical protein n=1 Tax=Streptomyces sp. NPDC057424 TaxID=3346127 RepID=UPI0036C61B4F
MNEPLIPASEEVNAKERADRLIATAFRDDTPLPPFGPTPPVAQPGIPPQSKAAVDYAVRVLSTGVSTALCSGGVALVMAASQVADPVVCGIVFGAPIGLAVPIAALSAFVKRTKQVAPAPTVNNYSGTVYQDQRNVHSSTRGVWAKTTNQQ